MKKLFVILFFGVLATLLVGGALSQNVSDANIAPSKQVNPDYLFTLVREYRSNKGLSLNKSSSLCSYAQSRLEYVNTNGFTHDGFYNDTKPAEYQHFYENLAENIIDENQILVSWLASPSHKENLDSIYPKDGCVVSNTKYTVLIMGQPLAE